MSKNALEVELAVPKVTPVNWKEPTPQVEAGNKHQD